MSHPSGGGGRVEALCRGCGIAVLAVAGLACAVVLFALWDLHRSWDRKPPDISGFAHAASTRTADAAAARTSAARLAQLTSALPWAAPLGTSVADACRTENISGSFGGPVWAPAHCVRNTVVYVAFDGDIRTRLHQLDSTLAAQGWSSGGPLPGTLTGLATWMSQAGGDPSPASSQQGSTEPPGSQPTCLSSSYGPPSQGHGRPHGGVGVSLRVAVAARPCVPQADTGDTQLGGAPEKDEAHGAVYLAWSPLSTDRVSFAGYAAHRYVAAFSFVTTYAVQSTPTTSPPPPPTRYGAPPCLTGSHCG